MSTHLDVIQVNIKHIGSVLKRLSSGNAPHVSSSLRSNVKAIEDSLLSLNELTRMKREYRVEHFSEKWIKGKTHISILEAIHEKNRMTMNGYKARIVEIVEKIIEEKECEFIG